VTSGSSVKDHHIIVERLHLLHEFAEAHSLIDAGDGVGELRHEGLDAVLVGGGASGVLHASLHLVEVFAGVDLHRRQIGESGNGRWLASDLLAEGVAEVVCWICADNEDLGYEY
jgi:hypothetical protein